MKKVGTSKFICTLLSHFFTQLTHLAMERSALKHCEYIQAVTTYFTPEQLVFVNESACDRRTTYCGWAWAIKGTQAVRKCFFVRGKRYHIRLFNDYQWQLMRSIRYSILPGLSLSGILHVSIVTGSFDTEKFAEFIDVLLTQINTFPGPNSVIVMDNCRIHKVSFILDMIEARYVHPLILHTGDLISILRGMKHIFLPPYSPDFNLIETAFSAIKAYIRRNGDLYRSSMSSGTATDEVAVYCQLSEAVYSITAENAAGWFHHCGYIWDSFGCRPSMAVWFIGMLFMFQSAICTNACIAVVYHRRCICCFVSNKIVLCSWFEWKTSAVYCTQERSLQWLGIYIKKYSQISRTGTLQCLLSVNALTFQPCISDHEHSRWKLYNITANPLDVLRTEVLDLIDTEILLFGEKGYALDPWESVAAIVRCNGVQPVFDPGEISQYVVLKRRVKQAKSRAILKRSGWIWRWHS